MSVIKINDMGNFSVILTEGYQYIVSDATLSHFLEPGHTRRLRLAHIVIDTSSGKVIKNRWGNVHSD